MWSRCSSTSYPAFQPVSSSWEDKRRANPIKQEQATIFRLFSMSGPGMIHRGQSDVNTCLRLLQLPTKYCIPVPPSLYYAVYTTLQLKNLANRSPALLWLWRLHPAQRWVWQEKQLRCSACGSGKKRNQLPLPRSPRSARRSSCDWWQSSR